MQSEQSIPATIGMGKFDSAVVPARIIPISEIVTIPGIDQLTGDQLPYIAHTPVNLQWMSRSVYWLQRGRSAAALGSWVDPGWQADQVQLEDKVRATLHRVVAAAAAGDGAALEELAGAVPTTVSQTAKLAQLLNEDQVALFDLPAEIPHVWPAIAAAADPAERAALAMDMWNTDFCALVPQFYSMLKARLVDVRIALWRTEGPALLYFVEDGEDDATIWVGCHPEVRAGQTPPFWETLPEPARRFLTEVHPGFTMLDGESFGLAQPSYMSTFAAWCGWPGAIPDWERDGDIDSTRLQWLTYNGADTVYCTSPELPPGQVIAYTEDTHEIGDFGPVLDALMLSAMRLPS